MQYYGYVPYVYQPVTHNNFPNRSISFANYQGYFYPMPDYYNPVYRNDTRVAFTHCVMKIALKASNGQFVSAEGGGGGKILANKNTVGLWETFDLLVLDVAGCA